jgi:hypothetical protein
MSAKEIVDLILAIASLIVAIVGVVLGTTAILRINAENKQTITGNQNSAIDASHSGNTTTFEKPEQAVNGERNTAVLVKAGGTLNLTKMSDDDVQGLVEAASSRCLSNLITVVKVALHKLHPGEGHPLNVTWFDHFCADAKGASDADMQELWSELLAGQIKAPGRFSFNAMDILSHMSSQDAKDFMSITPFLFNGKMIFRGETIETLHPFSFYLNLSELQLLSTTGLITEVFELDPFGSETITNGNYNLIITNLDDKKKTIEANCFVLTMAGREIASLSTKHGNQEIVEDALRSLQKDAKGEKVRIEMKQIIENDTPVNGEAK